MYLFVGENKVVKKYLDVLESILKFGKKGGLVKGLGVGCMYGFFLEYGFYFFGMCIYLCLRK